MLNLQKYARKCARNKDPICKICKKKINKKIYSIGRTKKKKYTVYVRSIFCIYMQNMQWGLC